MFISKLAISERAISYKVAALPIFACRIMRGFIKEGLVLIFKKGKGI